MFKLDVFRMGPIKYEGSSLRFLRRMTMKKKSGQMLAILVMGGCLITSSLDAMEKMKKDHTMRGTLTGAGSHHASGTVSVETDIKGNSILKWVDVNVDRVPDGRVYLANDANYQKGIELGKLTQFTGTVEMKIPAGVNPGNYNSVVIWCKRFSVEIGHAFFEKEKMQ